MNILVHFKSNFAMNHRIDVNLFASNIFQEFGVLFIKFTVKHQAKAPIFISRQCIVQKWIDMRIQPNQFETRLRQMRLTRRLSDRNDARLLAELNVKNVGYFRNRCHCFNNLVSSCTQHRRFYIERAACQNYLSVVMLPKTPSNGRSLEVNGIFSHECKAAMFQRSTSISGCQDSKSTQQKNIRRTSQVAVLKQK